MSTTQPVAVPTVTAGQQLAYDVFMNEPPHHDSGLLPNGEPKGGSPVASTLIYGEENAVLTDPGFTADHAHAVGDWVASKGRKVTDIFITHGHGDHWFAAGLLAERFGARVVATSGTIAQMHVSVAARPFLWDKVYPGIPPSPVTAMTVPGDRFKLEGHDLIMVEVGHGDTDDNSVLHIPNLGLVVAGDVIYNRAHQYIGESVLVNGLDPWRGLHYDWSDPNRVVMTTTDSNVWGGHSGHAYSFTHNPDGTTTVDAVVVREGKNFKGRLLEVVIGTIGKGALASAFGKTVKAIEARNDRAGTAELAHRPPA